MNHAVSRRCALCHDQDAPEELIRLCGVWTCEACREGPLPRRLEQRGWNAEVGERENDGIPGVLAVIDLQRELDLEVTFCNEGLGHKAAKLLRLTNEPQVGDDRFDNAVYISTFDTEATAALLDEDGAQSAILEILRTHKRARVHIEETGLTAWTRKTNHHDLLLKAALVACHVERAIR